MAIQLVSVKCPDCGATLSIESERESVFCSYCGAKVIINNENEHIYRNIDEARIKEAETDRIIKLRQLEMEEKSNFSRKTMIIIWLSATAVLLLIGIIGKSINNNGLSICFSLGMLVATFGGMAMLSTGNKSNRTVIGIDEVVITAEMMRFREKNYNDAVMLFRSAGFSNVDSVPLHDLNMFTQGKNAQVYTISINGNSNFKVGDAFSKSSKVLISYHSR